MHKRYISLFYLLTCLLPLAMLTACSSSDEDSTDYSKVAEHTVLMYLNGDNNLASILSTNIKDAESALRDSALVGSINLVIFKDTYKYYSSQTEELPQLFWVHRNAKQSLDTVPLLTFDTQVNALDPAVMKEVICTTFKRFDTKIKGVVFGSHALGWAPSDNYTAAPRRNATSYYGVDQDTGTGTTDYMEIWEMGEALKSAGVKFDYAFFDACNMGGAENAYEFRNFFHYMVASPTEIEEAGLPYSKLISRLSKCQTTADLPAALDYCALCYHDRYKNGNGATIAVYDLTQMDQLASTCASILQSDAVKAIYQEKAALPNTQLARWQEQFQHYGRASIHSLYYFYDLQNVLDIMSPTTATQLQQSLDKVVISNYYTQSYHEIKISQDCGMSMALTPTFGLNSSEPLMSAYLQTQWGQLMNQ